MNWFSIDMIPVYAMVISILAMVIQLVFGVLGLRRAQAETNRQVMETKKQEALLAVHTEEGYKQDVREWGRDVLDAMAYAQQLTTINPDNLGNHDFDIEKANTVAKLRSLLNRAKWLFPNLAIPTREDKSFSYMPERKHSALETILYAYHGLDQMDETDEASRKKVQGNIRRYRNEFMHEMRRAVDPQVRGSDIEKLVAEIHQKEQAAQDSGKAEADKPGEEEE